MDQPYSPWADWLSKFHTSSEFIQALWILSIPLTVLGTVFLAMRGVREIAAALTRREEWQGHVLYAIYRATDGRWLVYARGAVKDLTAEDCPEPAEVLAPPRIRH